MHPILQATVKVLNVGASEEQQDSLQPLYGDLKLQALEAASLNIPDTWP